MFHQVDTVFNATSSKPIPGALVQVYDDAGAIAAIFADQSGTPIESVSGIANTAVTDGDGVYDFWVADGTYDLRFFVGQSMVRSVPKIALDGSATAAVTVKANASALGVLATDSNLGTFAGETIPPDQTAKQALQAVETAVEQRVQIADLAAPAPGKGAGLVGVEDGRTAQEIFTALKSEDGAGEIGASIEAPSSIMITVLDFIRGQSVIPAQFGLIGDGETMEDPVKLAAFLNAIKNGKKGYLPSGCWLRTDTQFVGSLANNQHFSLEGANPEQCGFRFSGGGTTFLRFNYANIFNTVSFSNVTMATDAASDAGQSIALYGLGHAGPGNASQNIFENVIWRGWDGRVQAHYWGNALFTMLVNNVKVIGGGVWGPNDPIGKGRHFSFNGDATNANPYATHFDIEKTYFTQFDEAVLWGDYAQGLTFDAVNANNGNYMVRNLPGQTANDILVMSNGCQANTHIASIAIFDDDAVMSITDMTFVIYQPNGVGIRTASRWGRIKGCHFQGIGAVTGTAGVHLIDSAHRNVIAGGNVFSYLPTGILLDVGTANNKVSADSVFDNVTTKVTDNGTSNQVGTLTI